MLNFMGLGSNSTIRSSEIAPLSHFPESRVTLRLLRDPAYTPERPASPAGSSVRVRICGPDLKR
jgi:hypothetical protein